MIALNFEDHYYEVIGERDCQGCASLMLVRNNRKSFGQIRCDKCQKKAQQREDFWNEYIAGTAGVIRKAKRGHLKSRSIEDLILQGKI